MDDSTLWATISGALISATFAYFPSLRTRFGALDADRKRVLILTVVALVSLGLSFSKFYDTATCPPDSTAVTCGVTLAFEFVRAWLARFLIVVISSQGAFLILPGKVEAEPHE